jgi:DNA-binding response OmpR family regulator
MSAGAADYLSKPFSPRELAARLSAYAEGPR